jgi:hypothetical protein
MITDYGKKQIINKIMGLIAHGAYVKDGQVVTTPIFRTELAEDTLRVYLYLTDEDVGTFSDFRLIDASGQAVMTKQETIVKDDVEGLLIAFEIAIQEVIN